MGHRKKKVRTTSNIPRYFYCNYCGKSVSPAKIIWGWNPLPAIYCSDECKDKLSKKEISNETSISSNIG